MDLFPAEEVAFQPSPEGEKSGRTEKAMQAKGSGAWTGETTPRRACWEVPLQGLVCRLEEHRVSAEGRASWTG